MDKLTLDTNVLRDWSWVEGKILEKRYNDDPSKRESLKILFSKLTKLRDEGICEIGITNQICTDFEKDWNELPTFINEMIGSHVSYVLPSISTLPMMLPFVLLDEDEVFSILNDVFPGAKPEHKKFPSYKKDALQLYAHKVANRDVFLTSDEKIILSREILFSKWKIKVMTLEEYINNKVL
ncbi:MAG: hypothetical protein Q8L41_06470 [Anaerolineales bacterium]|nr:hypothetical protein [Anaerolineales bacterium]